MARKRIPKGIVLAYDGIRDLRHLLGLEDRMVCAYDFGKEFHGLRQGDTLFWTGDGVDGGIRIAVDHKPSFHRHNTDVFRAVLDLPASKLDWVVRVIQTFLDHQFWVCRLVQRDQTGPWQAEGSYFLAIGISAKERREYAARCADFKIRLVVYHSVLSKLGDQFIDLGLHGAEG